MVSKIVLVALCLVVAATAIPASGSFGPPSWVVANMPWIPKFTPCTQAVGASCIDCNTKHICTKVGGLSKACDDPTLPYCDLGECVATPNAQCAAAAAAPAVPATLA